LGGAATNFYLPEPSGVAVDAAGNLFISFSYFTGGFGDTGYVYHVWTNGIISEIAGFNRNPNTAPYGDGGPVASAVLLDLGGIAVDTNDDLFISDNGHERVRKIVLTGPVLTLNNLTTNKAGVYDVIVNGPNGSSTSSVVSLTVLVPATITAQPQNQFVPVGSNTTLQVTAIGTPTLDYQWYFDGAALTGKTNSALELTALSPTNAGRYQVLVANLYGAATSSIANLSVGFAPQITVQPQPQAVLASGSAVLTVTVSGTGPLSYQWQWNGMNLPTRTITTFAGGGAHLGDGGPATNATLDQPRGLATDANGDLFIADYSDNRVREVGANGVIATVAGNGTAGDSGIGGAATQANLEKPASVALDTSGNLFIVDFYARICRVGTNGIMTDEWSTNLDLIGTFSGIAAGSNGTLFTGYQNHYPAPATVDEILKIAGNGTLAGRNTNVALGVSLGLAPDGAGNLFIADQDDSCIRRLGTNGIFTTIAGNGHAGFSGDGGPATNALLNGPLGVAVDALGNLFIADTGNNRVREVGTNGIISTIAGNGTSGFSGDGGAAASAAFNQPCGVAVDAFGNLFIADTANNRIRLAAQGPAFAFTNISFTNAGNYDVVVSSPYGRVTSTVAAITVLSSPQNLSAFFSSGPGVQFQLTGTPGWPYVLLVATNLLPPVNWQPLVTNAADAGGNWSFTDTNTANPAQFYRAMLVTP
jgi:hypothetical protein